MLDTGNLYVDLIAFLYVAGSICIGIGILLYVILDTLNSKKNERI